MVNAAIRYCVDFKSDYHIGSGFGISGVVDDILVKDSKGRLFIPGATLKGIIRDACENLVDALNIRTSMCDGTVADGKRMCGVNRKGDTCLLCLIFGTEVIPSHFRFQSARRRDAVSELMGDERMSPFLPALSRVETHNRIEPSTGTSSENRLFAYELGRRTEPYEAGIFQIQSFGNDALEKDAFALLVAGMRFVMRMGGKRRRGKGRCRLHIKGEIQGSTKEYDWTKLMDHLPELLKKGGNFHGDV
jgi:CRISPR-associated protein Csx10